MEKLFYPAFNNGWNYLFLLRPTRWARVTHICVSKLLTTIASDNGFSPGQRQAIICINAGISFTGSVRTNSVYISVYIVSFRFSVVWLLNAVFVFRKPRHQRHFYAGTHGERRLIALVSNAALLRLMGQYVLMTSTLTNRPSTPWRTYLEPCRNVLHPLQASVSKMVRTNQIHVDVNRCCSDLKTLSASLAVCEGNPPGTGRFHSQRANGDQLQYVHSFRFEKQLLKKQSICWWLETPCHSLTSYRF